MRLLPTRTLAGVATSVLALIATAASVSAQTIGTFRWQMLPACNVVSITVTQAGSLFQLIGTDDLCGLGQVPLNGSAVAVGSEVRMGFDIAVPSGRTSHVTATVSLGGNLSGTWRDDTASSGTFAFLNGAPVPGALRPTPSPGRPAAAYRGDGASFLNLGAGVVNVGAATITVPTNGTLVTNGHISMSTSADGAMVDCALSLDTAIDNDFTQRGTASQGHVVSISTARHFSVLAGTHTVRLLCRRFTSIAYNLAHPQISVLFVP